MDVFGEGHAEELGVPVRVATEGARTIVAHGLASGGGLFGCDPLVAKATPTIFRRRWLGVVNRLRKIIAATRIGSQHRRFSGDVGWEWAVACEKNHRCHPRQFFICKRTTLLIGCNEIKVGQTKRSAAAAWSVVLPELRRFAP